MQRDRVCSTVQLVTTMDFIDNTTFNGRFLLSVMELFGRNALTINDDQEIAVYNGSRIDVTDPLQEME